MAIPCHSISVITGTSGISIVSNSSFIPVSASIGSKKRCSASTVALSAPQ